jgi:hypothetical protein
MLAAQMCLGPVHSQRGDLRRATAHFRHAIELCDAGHGSPLVGGMAEEPAVFTRSFGAIHSIVVGDGAAADRMVADAIAIAAESGPHAYGNFLAGWAGMTVAVCRRDAPATLTFADQEMAMATAEGFAMGGPYGYVGGPRGWALALLGDVAQGVDDLRKSIDVLAAAGATYMQHWMVALLADAYLVGGGCGEAVDAADEGLASVASTGECWYEAELHRLRGEALAGMGRNREAVAAIERAVATAVAQGAAGLEGRARRSLAALVG